MRPNHNFKQTQTHTHSHRHPFLERVYLHRNCHLRGGINIIQGSWLCLSSGLLGQTHDLGHDPVRIQYLPSQEWPLLGTHVAFAHPNMSSGQESRALGLVGLPTSKQTGTVVASVCLATWIPSGASSVTKEVRSAYFLEGREMRSLPWQPLSPNSCFQGSPEIEAAPIFLRLFHQRTKFDQSTWVQVPRQAWFFSVLQGWEDAAWFRHIPSRGPWFWSQKMTICLSGPTQMPSFSSLKIRTSTFELHSRPRCPTSLYNKINPTHAVMWNST